MRRVMAVPLVVLGILGTAAGPPPLHAAGRADAAVGVWVQRTHPSDDVAGARTIVGATNARPARKVLTGDGEGMDYVELRFTGSATSTRVVIRPIVPGGMHLDSGGCDRKGFNGAYTAIAPFDVVARSGQVVMTLGNRQSASCIFVLAPGSPPDTATAVIAPPTPAAPWTTGLLAGALFVGLGLSLRRTSPPRVGGGPRPG